MDALQWMGAVRMRVQTADTNITIIHTTPVQQLTSWEAKKLHVYKKQIHHQDALTLNHRLTSVIHNNASSSAQIKHRLLVKRVQNSSK